MLLTGGTGYVGSHAALALLGAGYEPVLLDNTCNSSRETLAALAALAGREVPFVEGDAGDPDLLDELLGGGAFTAVVHLAALKAGDAAACRAANVAATGRLVERMGRHGIRRLLFASSAAVYAGSAEPLREDAAVRPGTAYGRSKLATERLLRRVHAADAGWRIGIVRCFNAAGAHPSGRLADDAAGPAGSLVRRIGEVALGTRERLEVFGGDWPTPDGTCVRDFVHVADLAAAHVGALDRLGRPGVWTLNLGSGSGHSVLQTVRAFERASGRRIATRARRARLAGRQRRTRAHLCRRLAGALAAGRATMTVRWRIPATIPSRTSRSTSRWSATATSCETT